MRIEAIATARSCLVILALGAVLVDIGCASASHAPATLGPSFEQRMASILRLEDARLLREPPPAVPAPPPQNKRDREAAAAAASARPDLTRYLSDPQARVRRRAALAVGRVGLHEGVAALQPVLADQDPEVRQMAAFALGLLADKDAIEALEKALDDASPLVRGSAAEALGLIGDPAAAPAVGRMVAAVVESGALNQTPGDDEGTRRDTPAAAFRLGVFSLVRLKGYDALASAALNASGQPRVRWWPLAYALQRIGDKRGFTALASLAKEAHPYTKAFAVKGLGVLQDPAALPIVLPLLGSPDRLVRIEAIRACAKIGDPSAADPLLKMIDDPRADPFVRLESVTAIGSVHARNQAVNDALLDLLGDPSPAMRAAALGSIAKLDPDNFMTVLSGLDPDSHWSVRAAMAAILGTLPRETGEPRLVAMLKDTDQRVLPSVLEALAALKAPDAAAILRDRLKADDLVVRAAAISALGDLKPPDGAPALAEAYDFSQRDANNSARAAALEAIAKYGAEAAVPVLTKALQDKDWSLRVRAASLLKSLDPAAAEGVDTKIRPAPTTLPAATYDAARLTNPPTSTQAYIDTDRGTIQIEFAVNDAPLTVENFLTLARQGYYNGLTVHRVVANFVIQGGDPRGDGEGAPGYTIRDEFNELPYLRGAVGMALDPWPDSGGSQFFIALSPQPHLDAKYTVFGRVISGMDVVDQIQQWDVIRRIRIWDGQQMTAAAPPR